LVFVTPLFGKIYWGLWDPVFTNGGDAFSVQKIVREVGRKPSIVMTYLNFGDSLSISQLNAIRASGAIPIVTVQPGKVGELAAIARGDNDSWTQEFAEACITFGQPLFVRFAHEMNGDWFPWAQSNYEPGTYKNAWNHFFEQMKRHNANNVNSVWCPIVEEKPSFESVWPGEKHVDWLCLDGYSKHPSKKSFVEVFSDSIKELTKLSSKPIMIGETGVTERDDPSFKVNWIFDAFENIPRMNIQAFLWFNENKKDSTVRYDTSQASQSAFMNGINSGYFTEGEFAKLQRNFIVPIELISAKRFSLGTNVVNATVDSTSGPSE